MSWAWSGFGSSLSPGLVILDAIAIYQGFRGVVAKFLYKTLHHILCKSVSRLYPNMTVRTCKAIAEERNSIPRRKAARGVQIATCGVLDDVGDVSVNLAETSLKAFKRRALLYTHTPKRQQQFVSARVKGNFPCIFSNIMGY